MHESTLYLNEIIENVFVSISRSLQKNVSSHQPFEIFFPTECSVSNASVVDRYHLNFNDGNEHLVI